MAVGVGQGGCDEQAARGHSGFLRRNRPFYRGALDSGPSRQPTPHTRRPRIALPTPQPPQPPPPGGSQSNAEPTSPVELTRTNTEFEAAAIAEALRAQGIQARVLGGNLAGMRAEAPALASVIVRRMDLPRATEVLRAVKADSIDIDWNEVDVGDESRADPPDSCIHCGYSIAHVPDERPCPECGKVTPLGARQERPKSAAIHPRPKTPHESSTQISPTNDTPRLLGTWVVLLIMVLAALAIAGKLVLFGAMDRERGPTQAVP
ncbi:MAG: DUF2007 domain-containing protein [Phycisphaerales bacterium]|nr:DUF2007 domain-containing protein [Phycisphaerales bacterium]